MTIGEKIRNRRKELKMSQTELAERTGYADKSGISKVENGLVELGLIRVSFPELCQGLINIIVHSNQMR